MCLNDPIRASTSGAILVGLKEKIFGSVLQLRGGRGRSKQRIIIFLYLVFKVIYKND